MNGSHVHDLAEPYALGVLDDAERAAVDAHVATCDECARHVGEAEETVASLVSTLPSVAPSAASRARLSAALGASGRSERLWNGGSSRLRGFAPLATAAALALALGGSLVQNRTMQDELGRQNAALTNVVHGHFLHVSMTPASGATLVAKVLYARDGSWIYVLADGAPRGVRVVATIDGAERDLGPLEPAGGDVSAALSSGVAKPSAVSLREGARTLASAELRY